MSPIAPLPGYDEWKTTEPPDEYGDREADACASCGGQGYFDDYDHDEQRVIRWGCGACGGSGLVEIEPQSVERPKGSAA